jgi:hypothetical protein
MVHRIGLVFAFTGNSAFRYGLSQISQAPNEFQALADERINQVSQELNNLVNHVHAQEGSVVAGVQCMGGLVLSFRDVPIFTRS